MQRNIATQNFNDNEVMLDKQYQAYRDTLLLIRGQERNYVNRTLKVLLKQIIYETMSNSGIGQNIINDLIINNQINICISGSLARNEATPFSDIDCFIILSNKIDENLRDLIKIAMKNAFNIANKLYMDINQFSMDPCGINLKKMTGTIEELIDIILGEKQDKKITAVSIITAIAICNEHTEAYLLTNLQELTMVQCKEYNSNFFFNNILHEYFGPKWNSPSFIIKEHIARPLDFLVQGLRLLANQPTQYDGSVKSLLNKLIELNKIDIDSANLILYLKEACWQERNKLHMQHLKEEDEVSTQPNIQKLIIMMALLRGCLYEWLNKTTQNCFSITHSVYLTGNNKLIGCPIDTDLTNIDLINDLIQFVIIRLSDSKKSGISFFSTQKESIVLPWMKSCLEKLKSHIIDSICHNNLVEIVKELNIIKLALANYSNDEPNEVHILNEKLDCINELVSKKLNCKA